MSMTELGMGAGGRCGTHPKQSRFVMPIADDVRLVTVDTARAVVGVTAEEIAERCEDHHRADHLMAFDVSLEMNGRRELRIWARALRSATAADPDLNLVLADALLTTVAGLGIQTFNLNASQLERAWCVSNQTILRLIGARELTGVRVGRNWKVNRASAAEFLKRRAL